MRIYFKKKAEENYKSVLPAVKTGNTDYLFSTLQGLQNADKLVFYYFHF